MVVCNFPGDGIIIRQHPVTQLVEGDQIGLRRGQPVPDFGRSRVSMDSQDRAERAPLKPAGEQFVVIRRSVLITRMKETAGVGGPIRQAGQRKIQAAPELPSKGQPVAADVTGPSRRRITLLAKIRGARKNHHPLAQIRATLTFVGGLAREERIAVAHAICRASEGLHAVDGIAVVARLGRILPPSVRADAVKRRVHVFPTQAANGRIETSIQEDRGTRPWGVADSALPAMPLGLDHTEIMYLKWLV